MMDVAELERILRKVVAAEDVHLVPALAHALATAMYQKNASTPLEPQLAALLRRLAGTRVTVESAVVSFGAGSTLGDVTIGDVAGHDLIKFNLTVATAPNLSPRQRRHRREMLRRVREFWIKGVLERSVHREMLLALGLDNMPHAAPYPWSIRYKQADQPSQPLAANTRLIDLLDDSGSRLLILGAPGSGKTIMLLDLARSLIERAEGDEEAALPVVFQLSTWRSSSASFGDWLVDELVLRYEIPSEIAREWLQDDVIIPLLDGLDEVAEEQRAACVEAINAHQRGWSMAGFVVCSRTQEYENLTKRLAVQIAVGIRPLNPAQIEQYLQQAGDELGNLRALLAQDGEIRELAQTPLMLSIMAIVYSRSRVVPQILFQKGNKRQHLFDLYVEQMLIRRPLPSHYTSQQVWIYLGWIAYHMQRELQSVWYIENLKPEMLDRTTEHLIEYSFDDNNIIEMMQKEIVSEKDLSRYRFFVNLLAGLLLGCVAFVVFFVVFVAFNINALIVGFIASIFAFLTQIIHSEPRLDNKLSNSLDRFFAKHSRGPLISELPIKFVDRLVLSSGNSMFFYLGEAWFYLQIDRTILRGVKTMKPQTIVRKRGADPELWSPHRIPKNKIGELTESTNKRIHTGIKDILTILSMLIFLGLIMGTVTFLTWNFAVGFQKSMIIGVLVGTMAIVVIGVQFKPPRVEEIPDMRRKPAEGIYRTARNTLLAVVVSSLLAIPYSFFLSSFSGLFSAAFGFFRHGLAFGFALTYLAVIVWGWKIGGGNAIIQHLTLRMVLIRANKLPLYLNNFLGICTERILLRKVGSGYLFIHRLLLIHFADKYAQTFKKETSV